MPINPNALSSPEPDEPEPTPTDDAEVTASEEPAKRKRRTKRELTDAAVVPADDEVVLVEDIITGAKIERPWLVALEMVRDKKAKFADKAMNYAMAKYDEQKMSDGPASQEPMGAADTVDPSVQTPQPATDESGQMLAPEGAEVGDEVVVGADTYCVGYGNVLVQGLVSDGALYINPKRRWQRALGAGADGPWEAIQLRHDEPEEPTVPIEQAEEKLAVEQSSNGKGDLDVQTTRLPQTMEPVSGTNQILIGTGLLEKIGLPQVEQYAGGSQLQVGPFTLSRLVVDDGRREKVVFADGREGEIISAAAEGFELLDNTVEFIAARFRGQLQSFLALVGVLKQPVS